MDVISLPKEHSLQLMINGNRQIQLVCTQEHLDALVIGWLWNEGIINSLREILSMQVAPDGSTIYVTTAQDQKPAAIVRCSGLGGYGLDLQQVYEVRPLERTYPIDYLRKCADTMSSQCTKYLQTGGMHCSALFDGSKMLLMYEDIGRHNTLDKLAGTRLLQGIDTKDCLLLTTGRISSDMVKKAGRMCVSVVASYTTPTDKAFQLAQMLGITLVGYLNRETVHIYTNRERIL